MNINHKMFLEWFNNYMTIGRFMQDYNLQLKTAEKILRKGYLIHESQFSFMTFEIMQDYIDDCEGKQ